MDSSSYNNEEYFLIAMSLLSSYPSKKINQLVEYIWEDTSFENLEKRKADIIEKFGIKLYFEIQDLTAERIKKYIENLNSQGIRCLTCKSAKYPKCLLKLESLPIVLFYKGDINLLKTPSVAMVGTRMPSFYGKDVTTSFAKELAKNGLTIISGLASGVDKISHEQALAVGGKTIAILGGGLNNIYPAMNTNLAKEIAEKGLILSEYKPASSPTRYTFPARNRIIALLSSVVLVTEAGEKSGALHTKNFALEFDKPIFAIPSNINSEKGKGTNLILKNKEAQLVLEPQDILEFMNIKGKPKEEVAVQSSFEENIILKLLKDGERTLEELMQLTNLKNDELFLSLTMLEVQGKIKKQVGNLYTLSV